MNVDVLATIDERDQTNDLESEEERIVRGATPEEELKAKQLSDKAHADETLQSNCNFARTNFTTETQRARRPWALGENDLFVGHFVISHSGPL